VALNISVEKLEQPFRQSECVRIAAVTLQGIVRQSFQGKEKAGRRTTSTMLACVVLPEAVIEICFPHKLRFMVYIVK